VLSQYKSNLLQGIDAFDKDLSRQHAIDYAFLWLWYVNVYMRMLFYSNWGLKHVTTLGFLITIFLSWKIRLNVNLVLFSWSSPLYHVFELFSNLRVSLKPRKKILLNKWDGEVKREQTLQQFFFPLPFPKFNWLSSHMFSIVVTLISFSNVSKLCFTRQPLSRILWN
jgi:hypothetical protein